MFGSTTRNTDSSIQLVINRQPENIPVPYELRGVITSEKWDYRIMQINVLCAKYAKPLFERCWLVFAVLATIIVPAALNRVIFDAITPKAVRDAFDRENGDSHEFPSNRFDGDAHDAASKYIAETRLINSAIFFGLFIVLWTPMIIWKRVGTLRARKMTAAWEKEDANMGATFVPKWTVTTPGVFNINGVVTITTPPNAAPTLFNPQAYLPPYILGPGQQQQFPQGWNETQPQSQVPYNPSDPRSAVSVNMAAHGNAPTYVSFPPPNGPPPRNGENPFLSEDEKSGARFDDVKV